MIKSYRELQLLKTFEERFEYLRLDGIVGKPTFGFERYANQVLYHSTMWRHIRRRIILRDDGCDLGISGLEIHGSLMIHHINPITLEDIDNGADCVFDEDNLITTRLSTHNALHYGDISLVWNLPKNRYTRDTCLW